MSERSQREYEGEDIPEDTGSKEAKERKSEPETDPNQITLDQYLSEFTEEPVEEPKVAVDIQPPDDPGPSGPIDPRLEKLNGWSIPLKTRAEDLEEALKEYSRASMNSGLLKAINNGVRDGYDKREIAGAEKDATAAGEKAFLRAIGANALEQAGYRIYRRESDDPNSRLLLNRKLQQEKNRFITEYIGPENDKKRKKYRKVLKEHQKLDPNKTE